jgi:hypothetical protein
MLSLISNAQDCSPFMTEKDARFQVNVASDEDCFTIKYRGADLVASKTLYATFYFNNDVHNLKSIMNDGTELTKKVYVTPDHAALNYNIKKKGKYAVKLSLFDSQLTAEAQQDLSAQVEQNKQKNDEALRVKQEASDKEWNDKLEKKKLEQEEKKAKEKAEQEKLDAERDAKWEAENKETFSTEHEESGTSFEAGGSGNSIEFVFHYEEKPVCDWNITVAHTDEDSELVVASGKTNTQGSFTSSYDGLLNVPFKITGRRQGGNGEVKWSVDGFWYINEEEAKAGKIVMDIKKFEEHLSEGGMSGMLSSAVSYARYGLTSHCE